MRVREMLLDFHVLFAGLLARSQYVTGHLSTGFLGFPLS
jgi:hypothetical protein